MTFTALGDTAVVVALGEGIDEAALPRVRALAAALEAERPRGIVDIVAAYATVTVFYDVTRLDREGSERPFDRVCRFVHDRSKRLSADAKQKKFTAPTRTVEVPVCYGGEFGPDLEAVARHAKLPAAEVTKLHEGADYLVHAIGFTPGFPYLGGLPSLLQTPRRSTPRLAVPAGSVGIGGEQAGIYPLATPGGWQLIGRTPLVLFRPDETEPSALQVGDRVKFRAITPEEFLAWK
ncbi:MAG: Allophanate hydrolase subunit 1 [Verrucomicrobia bacterium]|nr:Allophanate hydrolase subunit 1 [Verrucomicrobiota bacterium]